ncbi:uncharacterized protein LOC110826581 [Zootermopsis nevadensis]|uniref:uncharacterized protein LOC110826581 n=1 Tax=Zootermopsis nevadensis TaxID=136037 RepID=UPI000B8EB2BF|nr:uncharacterized protein LOC110826581 [Zootermopsis nevadensis]XP_021913041.1 uncharacterized protein LOC110826581 [Zootermopsis nevadensis]
MNQATCKRRTSANGLCLSHVQQTEATRLSSGKKLARNVQARSSKHLNIAKETRHGTTQTLIYLIISVMIRPCVEAGLRFLSPSSSGQTLWQTTDRPTQRFHILNGRAGG